MFPDQIPKPTGYDQRSHENKFPLPDPSVNTIFLEIAHLDITHIPQWIVRKVHQPMH